MAPTVTKTQTQGVHAALAELAKASQRIGRTEDALATELTALGAREPHNISAAIPSLKAEIAAVRADAVRKGVEPQLGELEARLATATGRVAAIALERAACSTATAAVQAERIECLRSHADELTALAAAATTELAERQATTQAAARDELEAYRAARAAIGLGAAALEPTPRPEGVTIGRAAAAAPADADKALAAAYRESFDVGSPERLAAVTIAAGE
jgi:hypothetical protein